MTNTGALIETLMENVAEEKKDSLRVLLENQAKFVDSLNESTFTGAIKNVPKLVLPLARRVMSNIIADQLVSVQPLKEKTGLYMAMRYVTAAESKIAFETEEEATAQAGRFNTITATMMIDPMAGTKDVQAVIDPATPKTVTFPAGSEIALLSGIAQYAAKQDTSLAETASFTGSNPFKEITIQFIQGPVHTKSRKLVASWTLEAAQDAQASLGINLEQEMIAGLAQTIANDIDREVIQAVEAKAKNGSNALYNYDVIPGYSIAEKYQGLYSQVLKVSNSIAARTRRGAANWMIVSPRILSVLQSLKSFNFAPSSSNYVDPTNIGLAGTVDGRFKVFTDIIRYSDDVLMGYKGVQETDAGLIYMPYIPLEVSPVILDGNSFMPRVMLQTRYAIADNLLGAEAYYGTVTVDNLV